VSDIERTVEEYMRHLNHLEMLNKTLAEYKKELSEYVDTHGEEDDKGHKWLPAGNFMLQKQRRQGKRTLDLGAAEEWARERGIWEQVSRTVEVLDEDALLAYVFENRNEDDTEEEFQNLHKEAPVSYAFMKPVEGAIYDY
jgi:hypothetical protein